MHRQEPSKAVSSHKTGAVSSREWLHELLPSPRPKKRKEPFKLQSTLEALVKDSPKDNRSQKRRAISTDDEDVEPAQ